MFSAHHAGIQGRVRGAHTNRATGTMSRCAAHNFSMSIARTPEILGETDAPGCAKRAGAGVSTSACKQGAARLPCL